MNDRKFRVHIERSADYGWNIRLYIADVSNPGHIGFIKPLEVVYEKDDPQARHQVNPTMEMPIEFGQQLIDELYRVGYRPSIEGGIGELGAVKAHLEDMRRLLRFQLGLEKPEIVNKVGGGKGCKRDT